MSEIPTQKQLMDACREHAESFGVPEHLTKAIVQFVYEGKPLDGFLSSVFADELYGAVMRADPESLAALKDTILFVYNELPGSCHGSLKRVIVWTEQGGELLNTEVTVLSVGLIAVSWLTSPLLGGVMAFLVFMLVTLFLGLALMVWRRKLLSSESRLQSLTSREAAFLLGNIILSAMAFSVLWGTIFPVISELVTGTKITVGAGFSTALLELKKFKLVGFNHRPGISPCPEDRQNIIII